MPIRLKAAVLCAALVLLPATTGVAAPGDLDPTFGVGGKARVDLGGSESAYAAAVRPDGRIVVTGPRTAAGASGAVVAQVLQPQGTLDPSFGGGTGWSRLDLDATTYTYAIALQPDGKAVVAGGVRTTLGAGDAMVARLSSPQGTLDSSFGGGTGWSRLDFGGLDVAYALALRGDGRVVAAGSDGTGGFVAQLRDPEGSLDPSYGGGAGWSAISAAGGANGVAIQSDGRIIAVGSTSGSGTARDFIVTRLLSPEGTTDPAFGGGTGIVVTDFGASDTAEAVAIQPDGKIVVAGDTSMGTGADFAVLRLLPDGLPDPSFSGDGKATIDFGQGDTGYALALQPDGRILVAGGRYTSPAGDMAVARLLPDGTPDPSFGSSGRSVIDFGADDYVFGLGVLADGRIVAAGDSRAATGDDIAIAQLQGGPLPVVFTPPPAVPAPVVSGSTRRVRCGGRLATITGTAASEVLRGTPRADVIAALGGGDRVDGRGGADIVCGGPGADILSGGAGADRLIGGPGADRLAGGAGRDLLEGGAGADRLLGGLGLDRLRGGAGRNLLAP